eukprot:m.356000 g.356000  ORF g.356000 m.356000 type:complete len:94 (+) comp84273_c0_seq1:41-322(+)
MNKLLLLRSEIVVVVAQSSPGTDKETSTFMVDMCYSLLATSQKFESMDTKDLVFGSILSNRHWDVIATHRAAGGSTGDCRRAPHGAHCSSLSL